jgi:hypothetical protein
MFGFFKKKPASAAADEQTFLLILSRFYQIQPMLPVMDDPNILKEMLNPLKNVVDISIYSYRLEVLIHLLCEICFVFLVKDKYKTEELKQYLDEIIIHGKTIYDSIGDPYVIIIHHLLMKMFYFQNQDFQKAIDELNEFKKLTANSPFQEDRDYVKRAENIINSTRNIQEMKNVFMNRMLNLFIIRSREILQGIKDTSIAKSIAKNEKNKN